MRKTGRWLRRYLLRKKRHIETNDEPTNNQVYDVDTYPSSYLQSLIVDRRGITATLQPMSLTFILPRLE